ncbi:MULTISPECIES: hypothetical protein [Streptomyces]|uniref:hypothetical protein n=1 Tax=Streptomyces TaxID=1883 RepID=UPI0004BD8DF7|nr:MULTISPECIES: hypothetical protein [Streptomyces]KOG84473.1 hypothetical protein ADK33_03470 [Streptomyces griseus subsp. rhodochrous]KUJ67866.1 hypothetical protein ACZ90_24095 [Streptomyces albus subsp. albus]
MATLLRGEVPVILQPAGTAQYKGAYCPPGVPFAEVRRGPFDGKTDIRVRPDADGGLPRHMTFGQGAVVYEHDGKDAKGRAVYRYAPRLSPSHRAVMDGVAEVYADNARKGGGR